MSSGSCLDSLDLCLLYLLNSGLCSFLLFFGSKLNFVDQRLIHRPPFLDTASAFASLKGHGVEGDFGALGHDSCIANDEAVEGFIVRQQGDGHFVIG
ncbi:hypothetical protein D3C75_780750 [compost metagenome]